VILALAGFGAFLTICTLLMYAVVADYQRTQRRRTRLQMYADYHERQGRR
jgi:hypothetical protein